MYYSQYTFQVSLIKSSEFFFVRRRDVQTMACNTQAQQVISNSIWCCFIRKEQSSSLSEHFNPNTADVFSFVADSEYHQVNK